MTGPRDEDWKENVGELERRTESGRVYEIEIKASHVMTFIILALITIGFFFLKPTITGFFVKVDVASYVDVLNATFTEAGDYVWTPEEEGVITSVRLSGSLVGSGNARVFIEKDEESFLIFDSGLEVEVATNITEENKTTAITRFENVCVETCSLTDFNLSSYNLIIELNNATLRLDNISYTILIPKVITIELQYKSGTQWDTDDDGVETRDGVVDLTVENSVFNWDVDEAGLCTRWRIDSLDNETSSFVCYGAEICCNFIGLESSSSYWNDTFNSFYGRYGATQNNEISAQVISAGTEVVASNWSELPVKFLAEKVEEVDITTTISTKQYEAVLGKPVKWQKSVKVSIKKNKVLNNLTIDVPSIAENISVKKINIRGIEKKPKKVTKKDKEIIIEENIQNEDEVIVEYYTTAPYSEEQIIDDKSKEIIIIGPNDGHYENVSVSTNLPIEVGDINKVKLYWIINESKELVGFESYDLNENGLYDNIEWIVPYLSNQTYELIIEITKAEHLDSNVFDISTVNEWAGGITFDSRDNSFWITNFNALGFVNHFNSSGHNQTDGFSTLSAGSSNPNGIAFDSRDNSFWIVDYTDEFVYHFNSSGDNQTDGFYVGDVAEDPVGITLDTRDNSFWITDEYNYFVYHFNSSGDNQTDGFDVGTAGSEYPYGIAFDSRDNSFWVVDYEGYVLHFNSSGDIQSDRFEVFSVGMEGLIGLTFDTRDNSFFIVDYGNDFVYHLDDLSSGGSFIEGTQRVGGSVEFDHIIDPSLEVKK